MAQAFASTAQVEGLALQQERNQVKGLALHLLLPTAAVSWPLGRWPVACGRRPAASGLRHRPQATARSSASKCISKCKYQQINASESGSS
ncbi:hypothetical protein GcM1_249211 [Golovinomyces cichoracearum]|uniref:Uncharacterized protein n=1 Tax=Golovinomyces cichoracearum TaxID=62708 RepID=A0A420IC84_9PEZI|nr:hypothetical protein GcM1_249211 [Golovinomyces cichoracearum]